jgi:hypothetical protein
VCDNVGNLFFCQIADFMGILQFKILQHQSQNIWTGKRYSLSEHTLTWMHAYIHNIRLKNRFAM